MQMNALLQDIKLVPEKPIFEPQIITGLPSFFLSILRIKEYKPLGEVAKNALAKQQRFFRHHLSQ